MRILHVTPHLGGGVGKAHAIISGILPDSVEQTFVLLETPRNRGYVNLIKAAGAHIIVAADLNQVARLAGAADIVQFEFWNHPRLFECFGRCDFPAMRSIFWSHISGLFKPVIQPGLIKQAARFVFTTEASLSVPSISMLYESEPKKFAVINSGFGYADVPRRSPPREALPTIAYLGTVDFVKMNPGFFETIDRLPCDDIRAFVWGDVDPDGEVILRAQAMRHPERIRFCGQTDTPALAMSAADIFFYPLQPDHYGTSENVLIEAMSLGLAPLVLNNQAEMAIIRHGETGLIAHSVDECVSLLQMLLSSPVLRARLGQNAIRYVAEKRTPVASAQAFELLWQNLLGEPAKHCDFRTVVGETPADWFLATQHLPGSVPDPLKTKCRNGRSKGTLAHFESAFDADTSLSRLRE